MQKNDLEKAANTTVLEKQKESGEQSLSEKLMPSLEDYKTFNSKEKTNSVPKCEPDFLPIEDPKGIFFRPTEKRERNNKLADEAMSKGEEKDVVEPTQGETMLGKAMAEHARNGIRHTGDSDRAYKKQSHALDMLEDAFKTMHPETAEHVITAANRDLAKDGLRLARTAGGETWLGERSAQDGQYKPRTLIAGENCIEVK